MDFAERFADSFFLFFFHARHNLNLFVETALQTVLAQKVRLVVYLVMRDLQIILFFVYIAVRTVVIFVLKVFEALLLVERGKQFAVSNLHLDKIHGKRR